MCFPVHYSKRLCALQFSGQRHLILPSQKPDLVEQCTFDVENEGGRGGKAGGVGAAAQGDRWQGSRFRRWVIKTTNQEDTALANTLLNGVAMSIIAAVARN